ncbi:hypothetical protein PMAYCL1PPCAC_03216, partial [Pristionchus mayeri]
LTVLLICIAYSSAEVVNRSKRAAFEPFQPLVGATIAANAEPSEIESITDDPNGMGVHFGAVKIAIMIAGVVLLGVILAVCFAWYVMPKDDLAERSPILRGGKVESRCHSHA